MDSHQSRPINDQEIAVIRAMLDRGSKAPLSSEVLENLHKLRVVGSCGCGCDSVDFALYDPQHPPGIVADGTGTTAAGGLVGIIIWGAVDAIAGLEVYDLGAGEHDLKLPVEGSIRGWGEPPM